MNEIEAVVIIAATVVVLMYAWASGWAQSSQQLRQRSVRLLSLADAKDAYDAKLKSSTELWTQAVGLHEKVPLDRTFVREDIPTE